MAKQAAPYLHPRLNAVGITSTNGNSGGDINIVQIFAVPRGAQVDLKTGTATIDGAAAEVSPITPHAPRLIFLHCRRQRHGAPAPHSQALSSLRCRQRRQA